MTRQLTYFIIKKNTTDTLKMNTIGNLSLKLKVTPIIQYQSKRFKRRKMMKGYLPWNHWTPLTFRAAIYKYVNEQDYEDLREGNSNTNSDITSINSINNKSIKFDYKTGIENSESFKILKSLDPITFKENSHEIYREEYRKKHNHKFKTHYEILNESPINNTYNFEDKINKDNTLFNPEIWKNYAFKTFIIDRTKFGNIPCYSVYQPKLKRFFTEVRNIKGSKEVSINIFIFVL